MLRALVLLLLLANLAFFAWTQGWIDQIAGARAIGDREPERLNRQVQPELVQILPASRAASVPAMPVVVPAPAASTPASVVSTAAPPACLEAGPFSVAEAAVAEAALRAALPDGGWTSLKSTRPGLWMVYLGKFKDREALLKRQEELRALKIEYDELRGPAELLPGMSLGRFEERSNAVNALEIFSSRGIRTAKVIEVRTPANSVLLRVERAAPAVAAQLAALSPPVLGKGFVPCVKTAGI